MNSAYLKGLVLIILFPQLMVPATIAQRTQQAAASLTGMNLEQAPSNQSDKTFPRSTPEAEGISSAAIMRFLDAVSEGRNELHSFVILRHGKIVSEGWWDPYSRNARHVMFSVSKSFTSTGIGLAISENKLQLTDKVISFFPESVPDSVGNNMRSMTVEHLLMMSTGMNNDPMFAARSSGNWPKAFFSAPVENKPGSVFKYNNMATFMLSAILQKATGQKLFDYLQPRLFEPLGISNVTWDDTPEGYTFGAIGLRLQTEDMARFGQLLLQKGKWNGQQLIPEAWVERATSFKLKSNDPGNKNPTDKNDWEQGYGYQFWRSRYNAYRADGMGGQFVIVLPEKDAVIALTCSAANTQEQMNLVWDYLLPAVQDTPLPANKSALTDLNRIVHSLTTAKPATNTGNPGLLKKISGKKIFFSDQDTSLQSLRISFKKNQASLVLERKGILYTLQAGKDRWLTGQTQLHTLGAPPRTNQNKIKVASLYTFSDPLTLTWSSKFIEESIGTETWTVRFEEDGTNIKAYLEIRGLQSRKLEGKIIN